jgi:hypothetical protein
MRHENGIAVGIKSISDEYLRRRKVLCSVYAGGACGVLVMYFLDLLAACGIDEDEQNQPDTGADGSMVDMARDASIVEGDDLAGR